MSLQETPRPLPRRRQAGVSSPRSRSATRWLARANLHPGSLPPRAAQRAERQPTRSRSWWRARAAPPSTRRRASFRRSSTATSSTSLASGTGVSDHEAQRPPRSRGPIRRWGHQVHDADPPLGLPRQERTGCSCTRRNPLPGRAAHLWGAEWPASRGTKSPLIATGAGDAGLRRRAGAAGTAIAGAELLGLSAMVIAQPIFDALLGAAQHLPSAAERVEGFDMVLLLSRWSCCPPLDARHRASRRPGVSLPEGLGSPAWIALLVTIFCWQALNDATRPRLS